MSEYMFPGSLDEVVEEIGLLAPQAARLGLEAMEMGNDPWVTELMNDKVFMLSCGVILCNNKSYEVLEGESVRTLKSAAVRALLALAKARSSQLEREREDAVKAAEEVLNGEAPK